MFGFVVDPVTRRARAFGADPLYIGMRDSNASHVQGQLNDYGAMIHMEFMKKKGAQYLDPAKQVIVQKFNAAQNDHEVLRALIKDVWLLNLSK